MLHAGTYGYVRGDMYLTGGSDRIAGNLAVSLSRNGGYGTNLFTGKIRSGRGRSQLRCAEQVDLAAGVVAEADPGRRLSGCRSGFLPSARGRISADRPAARPGLPATATRIRRTASAFATAASRIRADAEIGSMTFMSLSALRRMHARWSLDLDRGRNPCRRLLQPPSRSSSARNFSCNRARLRASNGWRVSTISTSTSGTIRPSPTMAAVIRRCSAAGSGRPCSISGNASSYAAYGQGTLPIGRGDPADARPALHDRGPVGRGKWRATVRQSALRAPHPRPAAADAGAVAQQRHLSRTDVARFAGPAFLR